MNEDLNFGEAVEALKKGKLVTRKGWNGKNMFLFMRPEDSLPAAIVQKAVSIPQPVKNYYLKYGVENVKVTAYICMKAADDTIVNGWLASQTDITSQDWTILEDDFLN
jgi:hypothetical protein